MLHADALSLWFWCLSDVGPGDRQTTRVDSTRVPHLPVVESIHISWDVKKDKMRILIRLADESAILSIKSNHLGQSE